MPTDVKYNQSIKRRLPLLRNTAKTPAAQADLLNLFHGSLFQLLESRVIILVIKIEFLYNIWLLLHLVKLVTLDCRARLRRRFGDYNKISFRIWKSKQRKSLLKKICRRHFRRSLQANRDKTISRKQKTSVSDQFAIHCHKFGVNPWQLWLTYSCPWARDCFCNLNVKRQTQVM